MTVGDGHGNDLHASSPCECAAAQAILAVGPMPYRRPGKRLRRGSGPRGYPTQTITTPVARKTGNADLSHPRTAPPRSPKLARSKTYRAAWERETMDP
jgi:hypothetical protein